MATSRPSGEGPSRTQKASSSVVRAFGWIGIFGIGAILGAILGALDVSGWLIGVIVSGATVVLGFFLRRELGG